MRRLLAVVAAAALLTAGAGAEDRRLDWAATSALLSAFQQPAAAKYEYGGTISVHDGRYIWSAPHTDHSIDSVRINTSVAPGDTLAGIYHIHPCMPDTHYTHLLSKPDVMMAYFNAVPMYMLDECTGEVHVYDPAIDHVRDTGVIAKVVDQFCRHAVVMLPTGRIVGNIGRHTESQDSPARQDCEAEAKRTAETHKQSPEEWAAGAEPLVAKILVVGTLPHKRGGQPEVYEFIFVFQDGTTLAVSLQDFIANPMDRALYERVKAMHRVEFNSIDASHRRANICS